MGWKPRVNAKAKCKIDKALFRCQKCGTLVYEGTSLVTFVEYQEKYKDSMVIMDKFHMDHISPVKAVDSASHDWNVYYERLFCEEDNFRGLCKDCHDAKSKIENKIRRQFKKK